MRLTAAEHDIGEFVEAKYPERQLETVRIDDLRQLGEMGGIFIVRIEDDDPELRPDGDGFLSSRLTAVVLPTPVDPRTAKWRPISSLTSISAGIASFWLNSADLDALSPPETVDSPKIVGAYPVCGRAEGGKRANAAMENGRARGVVNDLAVQLERYEAVLTPDSRHRPSLVAISQTTPTRREVRCTMVIRWPTDQSSSSVSRRQ